MRLRQLLLIGGWRRTILRVLRYIGYNLLLFLLQVATFYCLVQVGVDYFYATILVFLAQTAAKFPVLRTLIYNSRAHGTWRVWWHIHWQMLMFPLKLVGVYTGVDYLGYDKLLVYMVTALSLGVPSFVFYLVVFRYEFEHH